MGRKTHETKTTETQNPPRTLPLSNEQSDNSTYERPKMRSGSGIKIHNQHAKYTLAMGLKKARPKFSAFLHLTAL